MDNQNQEQKTAKKYGVELGALTACPVYESHKRGKNWFAVIKKDPKAPNGLGRKFLKRANGKYYYFVEELKVGDPVEIGADYYTGGNNPCRCRFYGIVMEKTEEYLSLMEYETAAKAIKAAEELKKIKNADPVIHIETNPLSTFSDDEILAEARRRGLI